MDDATGEIRRVYTNGFEVSLSNSDVMLNLMLGGVVTHTVHMSFTSTKSLSNALSSVIGIVEKATNHNIMPMEEVAQGLSAASEVSLIENESLQ